MVFDFHISSGKTYYELPEIPKGRRIRSPLDQFVVSRLDRLLEELEYPPPRYWHAPHYGARYLPEHWTYPYQSPPLYQPPPSHSNERLAVLTEQMVKMDRQQTADRDQTANELGKISGKITTMENDCFNAARVNNDEHFAGMREEMARMNRDLGTQLGNINGRMIRLEADRLDPEELFDRFDGLEYRFRRLELPARGRCAPRHRHQGGEQRASS